MYKRALEAEITRLAKQYPIVTVTGPRQSGKTTPCKTTFPDYHYVNLEEPGTREFAKRDSKGFLAQHRNRIIIDEVQRVPDLPS